MAFAYFMVHAHLRFWPILNGGEIVVANCFVAARGAEILSLAAWLDHRPEVLKRVNTEYAPQENGLKRNSNRRMMLV